ncbi:MAG: hypothetical protein MJ252_23900 [archaeon]|nr:hypothetical protein [archaeon]
MEDQLDQEQNNHEEQPKEEGEGEIEKKEDIPKEEEVHNEEPKLEDEKKDVIVQSEVKGLGEENKAGYFRRSRFASENYSQVK